METPAKGVRGFLLMGTDGAFIFRVYNHDENKTFTDYELVADDIELELFSDYVSLYDGVYPKLDYNSKVLGRTTSNVE